MTASTSPGTSVVVLLTPEHPDGELLDPSVPHFSALAQGLARGDGIFETSLLDHGRVRKLDEHLWRLGRSAGIVGLDIPEPDRWRRAVATAVAAWDPGEIAGAVPGEALVKLFALRGYGPENPQGYAWVTVTPMWRSLRPEGPLKVVLLERGHDSSAAERAPWLLLGAKTLSYAPNMAAVREARRRGADDVIFTSTDGLVLEGPTSTVIIKRGDTLVTPPAEIGILPGTTQRVLFRAAEAAGWRTALERLTPDDLRSADAVWLASSGRLLTQVAHLDDVGLPVDDRVHAELLRLLAEHS